MNRTSPLRLPLGLATAYALTACGGDDDVPRSAAQPGPGAEAACATLLSDLGKSGLLLGADMKDTTARSAPFDVRYLYIAGGTFDGTSACDSCASGCTANGQSCASASGGCVWWGCWQWDQEPPGDYLRDFVERCQGNQLAGAPHPLIPMVTYYQWLHVSGVAEGVDQVTALTDTAKLTRYFADYRFLLKTLGSTRAILHLEPDFWGYGMRAGVDPHASAASVRAANSKDCDDQEDNLAGFGRCLIKMARKYAPNAKVGLHASAWSTGFSGVSNEQASFDVVAEAAKLAAFMVEVGAGRGDYIASDMIDRDAAWYAARGTDVWWDETNTTLPNFTQALTWGGAIAQGVGLPLVWWQLPVGNMSLPNQNKAWQDNRVDYLFAHTADVASHHVVGLMFGAGNTEQTTPETDGGNLVAKVQAHAAAGGTLVCGAQ
jgi:hypothetical protein